MTEPDPNIPPPVAAVPPLFIAASSAEAVLASKPGAARRFLAIVLGLYLGFFLTESVVAVADDSLTVFLGSHVLDGIRGLFFLFSCLAALAVYGLMLLTPVIPKRFFLPLTLFIPVTQLAAIPFCIYLYRRIEWMGLGMSLFQLLMGLVVLGKTRGWAGRRRSLVPAESLGEGRVFSWAYSALFLAANLFALFPLALVYLGVCGSLAVDHFSEGFMALHPGGLTVQVRKYARDDGKTIELFPMSHVAEADFYGKISRSFPSNSIILMEGVTDSKKLLTNGISYNKMAKSLGLAEQKEKFQPTQGEVVNADVDIDVFSKDTIGLLNMIMGVHSRGMTAASMLQMTTYPSDPRLADQLFDDILWKRNRHLLEQIRLHLKDSDNIMVPWGVAHIPGIAREIQKSGFHLAGTKDYDLIRFGSVWKKPDERGSK